MIIMDLKILRMWAVWYLFLLVNIITRNSKKKISGKVRYNVGE